MGPRLSQRSWAAGAGSPFWRRTRHPCDQHGAASWCTSPCFISPRATATGSLSFDCASIALARHSAASSSPTAGTPTAAAARWCKTGRATDWRWTCGESSGAWRLVKPVERATTTQCSMCVCAPARNFGMRVRLSGVSKNKPPTTRLTTLHPTEEYGVRMSTDPCRSTGAPRARPSVRLFSSAEMGEGHLPSQPALGTTRRRKRWHLHVALDSPCTGP